MTDPETHRVLDILPKRTKYELITYFKQYDKEKRAKVKYFVSDMYKPYRELSETYFKNATIITDKYHRIRQAVWSAESVRKKNTKIIFKSSVTAYKNWFPQIVNSLSQPITNGFTEGCNNKIKVLKRNAYGYRRFDRFRKRILFMFSDAA